MALKILFVSWMLPPSSSACAFVTEQLSSAFTARDMVLVGERAEEKGPVQYDDRGPRARGVGRPWIGFGRWNRVLGWTRWGRLPGTYRQMIKIAREEACQVIVATYPNDIMLCAAYMAAKTLGLPLIPYFHNTYLEYMAEKGGVDYAVSRVLQPRVFKRAKVVCVISEGMRESLCGRYPEVRFEVLPHSFSGEPPVPVAQRRIAGRVRVAFLGTLSEANWDAMGRVASAVSAPETNCELTICSATPNDVFRRCGFADARVIYRRPSDRELISVLRQHDILLLPHGFSGTWPSIEYRTIFPTRTIPYLLSGRPILAHAPPDCFLSKWLRERKCADVVDVRSSDAVRVALQRLAADVDRRTEMARNGLLAVESFRAETVGAKLRKVVDDAVEETGRKYELKERAQEDG